MIVIGFLLAAWLATREARRRGLPDVIYDLGLVMLLSGLVGGRLLYYIENYSKLYAHESFLEFFKIWKGGLTFYGGAITGHLGGIIYCVRKRLPTADCMDVLCFAVPVAMGFGRLGCFLNGCCYGSICDPHFPLGVVFPPGSPAAVEQHGLGILEPTQLTPLPVHPAQLYQASHDFLLGVFMYVLLRRGFIPRGGGIPLLFTLYGVGRFCLEDLRGDNPLTWTGGTLSQSIAIVLIIVYGSWYGVLYLQAKRAQWKAERILEKTG